MGVMRRGVERMGGVHSAVEGEVEVWVEMVQRMVESADGVR